MCAHPRGGCREVRCALAGAVSVLSTAERPRWYPDPLPEGATRARARRGTCKHPGAGKDTGG